MNTFKRNTCPFYFHLFLLRLIFSVILRYAEIKGGKKKNSTSSTMKKSGRYLFGRRRWMRRRLEESANKTSCICIYIYVCTYTGLKMARGWRLILSHDGPCSSDGQVLGNYAPLNC